MHARKQTQQSAAAKRLEQARRQRNAEVVEELRQGVPVVVVARKFRLSVYAVTRLRKAAGIPAYQPPGRVSTRKQVLARKAAVDLEIEARLHAPEPAAIEHDEDEIFWFVTRGGGRPRA